MKNGKVDLVIASCVTLLLMIGLIMVFSASSMMANSNFGSLTYFFRKQVLWGVVTIILMIIVSKIDYRKLKNQSRPLLFIGISIALLFGLFLFGVKIKGACRWYSLGIINFQPSELAKIALIIYFAHFLSSRGERLNDFKTGLMPLMFISVIILFPIMLQPDLSTALMIALITGIMLFISRVKIKYIVGMALPMIPLVIYMMSANFYQRSRVSDWLNALSNPLNAGYQVKQSLIGIGRGGWLGYGVGQSKQKFFFLPDSHTDFIFSIIGEEFGFIGTTIILGLFLIILYRGVRIAARVPDTFGKFLAVGITMNIVLYAFINTAVVSMLLPATGLPMPFISYGGSHLVFMGLSVGVLLSISRHTSLAGASNNWDEFKEKRERLFNAVINS
ncbi:MAG: putative lipid II flippase FtsW [Calditrichales bacterium]|nr:putative lipid II flippase FtsW [Calditrichales bacterium]